MKIILSIEHNREYIPLTIEKGYEDGNYCIVERNDINKPFIDAVLEEKSCNMRIEYPNADKYYTFYGAIEIDKVTASIIQFRIEIKSAPTEHIKE